MEQASEKEEDARMEVEAAQAVYGDDCRVVTGFPPHLVLHVRPRTAEDSSIQFVEMMLVIKATAQYPDEPPHVYAVDTKGLDTKRQAQIINRLHDIMREQPSCPIIGILCEEAVEMLSNMNHPEGDCPLCLYPLVLEDKKDGSLPFMKLMSCYHCFHSSCILTWWKFLQTQNIAETSERKNAPVLQGVRASASKQPAGTCPVCRKLFDEKDIEHVLALLNSCHVGSESICNDDDEEALLHSDIESERRKQFEELLKLQQEKNGLIEPKKDLLVMPGMYVSLPQAVPENPGESSNEPSEGTSTAPPVPVISEVAEAVSLEEEEDEVANTIRNMNNHQKRRSHGSRRPRRQSHGTKSQWIKKETRSADQ